MASVYIRESTAVNVTINYNATIEDVTEIVGTTFVYVLLCCICTYLSYMYIATSVRSLFDKDFRSKGGLQGEALIEKIELLSLRSTTPQAVSDLSIRIIMGIALPWTLFAVAWSLYTGTVLGHSYFWTYAGAPSVSMRTPQDFFNYIFSGICCGCITVPSLYLAGRAYRGFENKETWPMYMSKYVLWALGTGVVVVAPGAYAFGSNPDVTVANNGYLVAFSLTSGIVLAVIAVLRVIISARSKEWDDVTIDQTKLTNLKTNQSIVQDVHVLSTGVQGDLSGAVYGYAPGINLPLSWIFTHYLSLTSAALCIYLDNTKPFVFTAVVCIVPWVMTLKSRQIYSYMAWHIAMSAYWILINVLTASITGPLGTSYEPSLTYFNASDGTIYYNVTLNKVTTQSEFFLTAPKASMLPNMRTTTDLFSISAVVMSFILILLNLMFYEPALTSGMKDPTERKAN